MGLTQVVGWKVSSWTQSPMFEFFSIRIQGWVKRCDHEPNHSCSNYFQFGFRCFLFWSHFHNCKRVWAYELGRYITIHRLLLSPNYLKPLSGFHMQVFSFLLKTYAKVCCRQNSSRVNTTTSKILIQNTWSFRHLMCLITGLKAVISGSYIPCTLVSAGGRAAEAGVRS